MQLKEAKDSLEESQKQHVQMVKALNNSNQNGDDDIFAGKSAERLELLQKDFAATTEEHL